MDLAGIEPASESLFIKASPITVAVLTFPWMYAHRQAYNLSSFMIHLPGQSLPGKVSHMVDARFPMCECNGADEQLRLLTLTFRLRLYLVPGWYAVQESADGCLNFKAPVETSTSPDQVRKDPILLVNRRCLCFWLFLSTRKYLFQWLNRLGTNFNNPLNKNCRF